MTMNEAQWQNRMTMLVNSCDAYEDLWQPFFTLLKRYLRRWICAFCSTPRARTSTLKD